MKSDPFVDDAQNNPAKQNKLLVKLLEGVARTWDIVKIDRMEKATPPEPSPGWRIWHN